MNIVLFQPEIPPNTGNIIRLCANTGSQLHLIEPMGFSLNEKSCRRAGLDYHTLTYVHKYSDWDAFITKHPNAQFAALTTKADTLYHNHVFSDNTYLLFGPETRGLSRDMLSSKNITPVRIPMAPNSRSLNLSNAVAIVLYESLRQHNLQTDKTLLQ